MAGKLPWMKFFVADYLQDTAQLTLETQGFWMRLLCQMHGNVRRGYLCQANGQPLTLDQIARITGGTTATVAHLRQELITSGVCSVTTEGVMFNRRMVRESELSDARSKAGKKGGKKTHLLWQKFCQGKNDQEVTCFDILPGQNQGQNLSKPLASVLDDQQDRKIPPEGVGGAGDFATANSQMSPDWLATEWAFYRKGAATAANSNQAASETFAEMIRGGMSPQAILDEIRSKDRKKTEAIWDFEKRMQPKKKPNEPQGESAEQIAAREKESRNHLDRLTGGRR